MPRTLTPDELESERVMFRDSMLAALDKYTTAMLESLEARAFSRTPGAADQDLPELFRVFDAQFDRILKRAGVTIAQE
jgi:hypothetical protein